LLPIPAFAKPSVQTNISDFFTLEQIPRAIETQGPFHFIGEVR